MKPPYVIIDATCAKHGRFRVKRKPNKYRSDAGGPKTAGFYLAVRCPVCPFYSTTIIKQQLVTADPAQSPDHSVEATLPGLS